MTGTRTLRTALELMKDLSTQVTLNEVIAFLCVCEHEGASIQEIAAVGRFTQSTASRSVRSLGPPNSVWSLPPALGLVDPYLHPRDGRSHVVKLTRLGHDIRSRLCDIAAPANA